jgi:hypothetical protein
VVFSHEKGETAVRLLASPPKEEVSGFAILTGVILAGTAITRFVPGLAWMNKASGIAAGAGTALAVIAHGYREVRERGNFDPEVLSVVYLLYSLVQGKGLTASFITWLASFGRHFFTPPVEGVLLNVSEAPGDSRKEPSFDLSVKPDDQQPHVYTFLKYLRAALADFLSGGSIGRERLIGRIREVQEAHNSILEGIGRLETSITIRLD